MAEVAFLDDRDKRVNISCIIWARGEAVFATDTSVFIYDNNPVFPLPGRLNRTVDDAGWVITLIAEVRKKMTCNVWILSFFNNLHPRAKYS
jgi:hypothetical protein